MVWEDWAGSGVLGTGKRKTKKKKKKEVGDLCSVPRHVSAACCLAKSVAGLQFQPASVSLLGVSAVSFPGVILFLKSWIEDFPPSLGSTEAKKVFQKTSTN